MILIGGQDNEPLIYGTCRPNKYYETAENTLIKARNKSRNFLTPFPDNTFNNYGFCEWLGPT